MLSILTVSRATSDARMYDLGLPFLANDVFDEEWKDREDVFFRVARHCIAPLRRR